MMQELPLTDAAKRYTAPDSAYLKESGGKWHLDDSPFKAAQVLKMLDRHKIRPLSVVEIGSGAGGILANLAKEMGRETTFTGYDISPDAHALSKQFESENVRSVLGEPSCEPRA